MCPAAVLSRCCAAKHDTGSSRVCSDTIHRFFGFAHPAEYTTDRGFGSRVRASRAALRCRLCLFAENPPVTGRFPRRSVDSNCRRRTIDPDENGRNDPGYCAADSLLHSGRTVCCGALQHLSGRLRLFGGISEERHLLLHAERKSRRPKLLSEHGRRMQDRSRLLREEICVVLRQPNTIARRSSPTMSMRCRVH